MSSEQSNGTRRSIALRKLTTGDNPEIGNARRYEGLMVDDLRLGSPIVVLYGSGSCVITSPVQRILRAVGERRQFVATKNSVYELRVLAR
jgi:hypothetical protein